MPRTIRIDVDSTESSYYEPEDLELFQGIVDDMVAEAAAGQDGDDKKLRARAAAALFRCAMSGERDPEVLKRLALAALRGETPSTGP